MKTEWLILIVSAMTDAIINAGTSLTAAMLATGSATLPSHAVLILSIVGGCVSAARTIQQGIRVNPLLAKGV